MVKPRKENKTRSNRWGGGRRQGGHQLEGTAQNHPLGDKGTPGFLGQAWKMALPLGDALRLHNGDFPLPLSYLKVIRFELWTHSILLEGPPFRHWPTVTTTVASVLRKGPPGPQVMSLSLSRGRLVSLKNSSQTTPCRGQPS